MSDFYKLDKLMTNTQTVDLQYLKIKEYFRLINVVMFNVPNKDST